ncbi:MAG: glycosyltransferase [Bryobacterales bacterium]|nr:glycosyltransferase [Bryobacterales bacterium]
MKLSILIPVYNERIVLETSVQQVLRAPLPEQMERELIMVDDCSTDGTWDILRRLAGAHPEIRLYRHEKNQGKGAAIRTAIRYATGDFCLVQDADLEYDPNEYPLLLKPLLDGRADAVFGSRYRGSERTRILPFWHSKMNATLTLISNMFSNLNLTDMETCYKVFRTDLLKSIPIRSDRFGFEPEITMKASKRKLRIYEVPISYHGRSYEEGKKINWKDGVQALSTILRFWLIDDLYTAPYGRLLLNNLAGTPQYLRWIGDQVTPYLGDAVLELRAGTGHLSSQLMAKRLRYVVSDKDPLMLHALENRFLRTPNVQVAEIDPGDPQSFEPFAEAFDSVVCLNVLEFESDPTATLKAIAGVLHPGARVVALVPHKKALFGSIDKPLGHLRRFERRELTGMMAEAGLRPVAVREFNRVGSLSWWIYGKILHRRRVAKVTLKLFDKSMWLWRRLDRLMPWPGLSLIVAAELDAGAKRPRTAAGQTIEEMAATSN